jgi:hypothetical protein
VCKFGTTQVVRSKMFFNESEAQMLRETNCFELFNVYAKLIAVMEFNGGRPLDDRQRMLVWRSCVGNKTRGQGARRRSRGVTRARPVNVRELALVKSCKRKVRW